MGVELGVRRNVAGDVHGSGRGRGAGSDERRWRRPAQVQDAEEVADAAPVSASSAPYRPRRSAHPRAPAYCPGGAVCGTCSQPEEHSRTPLPRRRARVGAQAQRLGPTSPWLILYRPPTILDRLPATGRVPRRAAPCNEPAFVETRNPPSRLPCLYSIAPPNCHSSYSQTRMEQLQFGILDVSRQPLQWLRTRP